MLYVATSQNDEWGNWQIRDNWGQDKWEQYLESKFIVTRKCCASLNGYVINNKGSYMRLLSLILGFTFVFSSLVNAKVLKYEVDGKLNGTSVATFGTGGISLGQSFDVSGVSEDERVYMWNSGQRILGYLCNTDEVNDLASDARRIGVSTGFKNAEIWGGVYPYLAANKNKEHNSAAMIIDEKVVSIEFQRKYSTVNATELLEHLDGLYGERTTLTSQVESSREEYYVSYGNAKPEIINKIFKNSRNPNYPMKLVPMTAGNRFLEFWEHRRETLTQTDTPLLYVNILGDNNGTYLSAFAMSNPKLISNEFETILSTCVERKADIYRARIEAMRQNIGSEL